MSCMYIRNCLLAASVGPCTGKICKNRL